jgi:3-oxoacyl-[acyl-carrier-protein] synthase-3
MGSRIRGIGVGVPDKVLTNFDLEKMVDTSDEWIRQRTGIRERRVVSPGVPASHLAEKASREVLSELGLLPTDIDMIIVATVSPDTITPSTACWLQKHLGITNGIPAFDISAGCTGFVYALSVADSFLRAGKYKRILVVGAEVLSAITDWTDRSTCVLLGDGAGAAILEYEDDDEVGLLGYKIKADGNNAELLWVPGCGSLNPASEKVLSERLQYLKMKGNELFKFAVREMNNVVGELLDELGVSKKDIDWVVPHQANIRIIQSLAKYLEISMDRVIVNIDKYGNTSSASIPLAMYEAIKDGKIKRGDLVVLVAFGAGLTWGAALIRW